MIADLKGIPRYAIPEIERRWLVDVAQVGDLADVPFRLFEDLYIHESRLRLRKITESNGNVVFKLGKKYGRSSALSEPITTLYLDENEYQMLSVLAGHRSSKRRYIIAGGSLDVYQRPASGPTIFELEFASESLARQYRPPSFVMREITNESAYSGYEIARGEL
jgi:CYTH domain-containing protein